MNTGPDRSRINAFGKNAVDPCSATRRAISSTLGSIGNDWLVGPDTRSLAKQEAPPAGPQNLRGTLAELQTANERLQAANQVLCARNRDLSIRGETLQSLNTHLEVIHTSLPQGMVIVDADLKVTVLTPSAVPIFGLLASDVGRNLLSTTCAVSVPSLAVAARSVIDGGERVSIEAAEGHISYLVHVSPYQPAPDHRVGAMVTFTDVSQAVDQRILAEDAMAELRDRCERYEREATYDSVTGLLNRGHFTQQLASAVARCSRDGSRLAVVWIDLDKFKEINDEHGHEAGDTTLRTTGRRVLNSVRASDAVGRLGGDEMGVLIMGYGTTPELDTILTRIVAAARETILIDGRDVRPTASVGVALFPEDGLSAKDLMRAADAAMYAIKQEAGDGYAYFDPSMNEAARHRRIRRREIAIAIDKASFVMHYQPVVDAITGAVWGVEALVRWPRDGSIQTAAQFVPFCEESGQIRALGALTMALLSSDSAALRTAGHGDLRIAFNLSVTQLEDRRFAELLEQFPSPGGLRGLVVEILESVFLPEHAKALQILGQMSRLGAEISLDDYGSGSSNIRLLESLGPDYIKLDGSFLGEHQTAKSRAALMRSAVDISHVVGSRVIAEGIETKARHAGATAAGVDFVQGYEIGRPMPMEQLLEWLAPRCGGCRPPA